MTGWCQGYRGCNLRTALSGERKTFGNEKKKGREQEPEVNNVALEHGKMCLLISNAVKNGDIIGEWSKINIVSVSI